MKRNHSKEWFLCFVNYLLLSILMILFWRFFSAGWYGDNLTVRCKIFADFLFFFVWIL